MNWKDLLMAVGLVALLSLGFGPDPLEDAPECQEGAPGCLCDGAQGECRVFEAPDPEPWEDSEP